MIHQMTAHIRALVAACLDRFTDTDLDALQDALQSAPAAWFGDEPARARRIRERIQQHIVTDKLAEPDWQPRDDADWDMISDVLLGEEGAAGAGPSRPVRSRRWWLSGVALTAAAAVSMTLIVPERSSAIPLLTAAEVHQEPLSRVTRGEPVESAVRPIIAVQQPEEGQTFAGDFPLTIRLSPGPEGVPLDPGTLQLISLRGSGIDVTDRIPVVAEGDDLLIDVIAEAPPGTHRFELYIEDIEQRSATTTLAVTVR